MQINNLVPKVVIGALIAAVVFLAPTAKALEKFDEGPAASAVFHYSPNDTGIPPWLIKTTAEDPQVPAPAESTRQQQLPQPIPAPPELPPVITNTVLTIMVETLACVGLGLCVFAIPGF